jgi:hypothetical protein
MASFCVFTADHVPLSEPESFVLVRDGFSWPAALAGPLWALGHGLWREAAGMLLVGAALGALARFAGLAAPSGLALLLGAALLLGWHAADLRTRGLWRAGYRAEGLIVAPDLEQAERRYVEARLGAGP